MILYANFKRGYSHRVDGVYSIASDENWITLLDKDWNMLASFSHEWISAITQKPWYTCYVEERIAAASQLDIHPADVIWCDECGEFTEKLW